MILLELSELLESLESLEYYSNSGKVIGLEGREASRCLNSIESVSTNHTDFLITFHGAIISFLHYFTRITRNTRITRMLLESLEFYSRSSKIFDLKGREASQYP